MGIFEQTLTEFRVSPQEPSFHEQWVAGTYIYTGVFPMPVKSLDDVEIISHRRSLFLEIAQQRQRRLPRGIAGYYAIPIYISNSISDAAKKWIRLRPRYKYAQWHEPIAYEPSTNELTMNTRWGLYCSAYRLFLGQVLDISMDSLIGETQRKLLKINAEQ